MQPERGVGKVSILGGYAAIFRPRDSLEIWLIIKAYLGDEVG